MRLFGVIPIKFSVYALLVALNQLKGSVAMQNITAEYTRPTMGINTGINITLELGAMAARLLEHEDPAQFRLCMQVLEHQRLCDEYIQASEAEKVVSRLASQNRTTGPFRAMNTEFQKALTQKTFCDKAVETLNKITGEIAGYSTKEICRRAILSLFPQKAKVEVMLEETVEAEVEATPKNFF